MSEKFFLVTGPDYNDRYYTKFVGVFDAKGLLALNEEYTRTAGQGGMFKGCEVNGDGICLDLTIQPYILNETMVETSSITKEELDCIFTEEAMVRPEKGVVEEQK